MLGILFGYMLAGGFDSETDSSNQPPRRIPQSANDTVWVNTEALHRVKDPLLIMISATGFRVFHDTDMDISKSFTYRDVFRQLITRREDVEVLRITRVLNPNNSSANFWFEYIGHEDLTT